MDDTAQVSSSTPSQLSRLTETHEPHFVDEASEPDKTLSVVSNETRMGQRLQEAMVNSGEDNQFLPNDKFVQIVTPEAIHEELQLASETRERDLDQIVDRIFSRCRRLFAILALLERAEKIHEFIQQGVSDSDLPIAVLKRTSNRRGKSRGFETWPIYLLETFVAYQWRLLAPVFQLNSSPNQHVRHYFLGHKIPLPSLEGEDATVVYGGYSAVRRVKIHPAHHNLCRGPQKVRPRISIR